MTSRRNALKKLFEGAAFVGTGGLLWGTAANALARGEFVLRPPGAISEKDFIKACIKCGKCVEACPYDTLKLAAPEDEVPVGTPFFTPRDIPCYMCTNIPCTEACPSGALDIHSLKKESPGPSINHAQMGLAMIHKESCIAYWGIQCDACYRACPLMDQAIVLEYEKNTHTGKHANLKPVVNSDVCTGCGICEHACVVEKAAIFVLPGDKATGKTGDHYIKSWDQKDEERIKNIENTVDSDKDVESALDYLNDGDDLIDE